MPGTDDKKKHAFTPHHEEHSDKSKLDATPDNSTNKYNAGVRNYNTQYNNIVKNNTNITETNSKIKSLNDSTPAPYRERYTGKSKSKKF